MGFSGWERRTVSAGLDTNQYWFRVYRSRPEDPAGLGNGAVWSFAEFPSGEVAVATTRGVQVLEQGGKFSTAAGDR